MRAVLRTLREVAEGMAFLHANDVLHCDLTGEFDWMGRCKAGLLAGCNTPGLHRACGGRAGPQQSVQAQRAPSPPHALSKAVSPGLRAARSRPAQPRILPDPCHYDCAGNNVLLEAVEPTPADGRGFRARVSCCPGAGVRAAFSLHGHAPLPPAPPSASAALLPAAQVG